MSKPTTVARACSECGTTRHWRGFICDGCGAQAEVPNDERHLPARLPTGWVILVIDPGADADPTGDYSALFCSQACALAHPDKWSA